MALSGNQGDKRMWPSLDTASWVADWANIFFIGSLVVGVASTIIIVWMATVKEDHWDALRRVSEEKIAESNARTKQAELELTRIRLPRSLDIDKFIKAVAGIKPAPAEVLYDANAPDAYFLASLIWGVLFNAKWDMSQQASGATPLGPPPPDNLLYVNMPWTQAAGGGPWGLSVVTNEQPDFDKNPHPLGWDLLQALMQSVSGPPSASSLGISPTLPTGKYGS